MLVLYGIYYVYAFVFLGQMSTKNVDLSFTGATSVGFRNFSLVLTDPLFWRALGNNMIFGAVQIVVALTLVVALPVIVVVVVMVVMVVVIVVVAGGGCD